MTPRSGVALLLVLATLVVVVTGAATLARIAATAQIGRQDSAADQLASGVLDAAETPIIAWLKAESSSVVLPPDNPEPSVAVLHDIMELDEHRCDLTIAAYDQFGMVPLREVLRGSPLRLALPLWARDRLTGFEPASNHAAGLDDLRLHVAEAGSVFPRAVAAEPLVFGTSINGTGVDEPLGPALGSLVATHNPLPDFRGRTRTRIRPPAINVNTAPIGVVEAALRVAGRGGLEQIIASRTDGTRFAPGDTPVIREGSGVSLVASSPVWAFRIDARVDRVHRAWWCVYALDGSEWKLVQRLVVTD